jgi:cyclase
VLKKRIIVSLLYKNGLIVKGKKFKNHKVVGNPESLIKIFSSQEADEIQLINISNQHRSSKFYQAVEFAVKECKMPITIGGNIKNMEQVKKLFLLGADKILVTTEAVNNYKFLRYIISTYGSQALLVGIEYLKIKDNIILCSNRGKKKIKKNILEYAQELEKIGTGEIMLISIDRDGMMKGYDLETNIKISKELQIPVIASSGAGNFNHLVDIFEKSNVQGAICGSIFYFADNNPIRARTYLTNQGIQMRKLR